VSHSLGTNAKQISTDCTKEMHHDGFRTMGRVVRNRLFCVAIRKAAIGEIRSGIIGETSAGGVDCNYLDWPKRCLRWPNGSYYNYCYSHGSNGLIMLHYNTIRASPLALKCLYICVHSQSFKCLLWNCCTSIFHCLFKCIACDEDLQRHLRIMHKHIPLLYQPFR
jgi:hypothetical protein